MEVEFFSELLILNDFIFLKVEDDGKVIASFFVDDVDVLDAVKEGIIVFSEVLADKSRSL